jgi:hypothetical protein
MSMELEFKKKVVARLSKMDHMEKTFECQFLFVLQASMPCCS